MFGRIERGALAGHLLDRSPFHWTGDETDLPKLMADVFSVRMAGGDVTRSQKLSLGPWLDRLPAPAGASATDRSRARPAASASSRVSSMDWGLMSHPTTTAPASARP